jgi:hypothetical protein
MRFFAALRMTTGGRTPPYGVLIKQEGVIGGKTPRPLEVRDGLCARSRDIAGETCGDLERGDPCGRPEDEREGRDSSLCSE